MDKGRSNAKYIFVFLLLFLTPTGAAWRNGGPRGLPSLVAMTIMAGNLTR